MTGTDTGCESRLHDGMIQTVKMEDMGMLIQTVKMEDMGMLMQTVKMEGVRWNRP